MKAITVILSFYFLALNVIPCNDAEETAKTTEVTSSVTTSENHSDTEDLCSPFCQCHCCHSHTVDFNFFVFDILQPSISQKNFVHFDSAGKDIKLSLLQPPRA